MLFVAVFSLLALSAVADGGADSDYSFSPAVGSGGGTSFSITGEGRITAIRVWERYSSYIAGLQVRYGLTWSELVGRKENKPHELELYKGEAIIQLSGKYTNYIYSLVIVTNMGRSLFVGQPSGHSFNMYPANQRAELRLISGQVNSYISSIAAHWAIYRPSTNGTNH